MRSLIFLLLLLPAVGVAQSTVVRWAYGPFGTPGDPAYVIEDGRIYRADGTFGTRGPCMLVVDGDRVYHAADAFGRKGTCAFVFEDNKLIRAQGGSCIRGSCALLLEGDRVFRGDGQFCNKQEGAFFLERDERSAAMVVHLADGPFASKNDALLEIRGPLDPVLLLALLAGH